MHATNLRLSAAVLSTTAPTIDEVIDNVQLQLICGLGRRRLELVEIE
jgi:hypothetical protein